MKITIVSTFVLAFVVSTSSLMGAPSKPDKPSDSELFAKGTEKLFKGDYKAAEKDLRSAVKANGKNAKAHNNLAFVLRKQGEKHFEKALEHYNRAIELDKDLAEAYMYRGVLYQAMGKKDLALADHARLLELGKRDLASELEWIITNGKEKEPAQFFGVVKKG